MYMYMCVCMCCLKSAVYACMYAWINACMCVGKYVCMCVYVPCQSHRIYRHVTHAANCVCACSQLWHTTFSGTSGQDLIGVSLRSSMVSRTFRTTRLPELRILAAWAISMHSAFLSDPEAGLSVLRLLPGQHGKPKVASLDPLLLKISLCERHG